VSGVHSACVFSLLMDNPCSRPPIFRPGGIHSNVDFWENVLEAGKWVIDLLKYGYKVPFTSTPLPSELDNNASVRQHHAVAEDQVMQLLQQGVLRKVDYKPHCVNPLGLVTKVVNNVIKHRLIFDGSRLINDHVDPPTVKLAHLQKALLKLNERQLLGVFDLKSCYFHVKIDPDLTTFFGVKLAIQGVPTYMVFDYLPFGLSSAVHCITKLWKPVVAYLQKRGIPISVYIDDGIFGAENAQTWNEMRTVIWDTISRAGWTIEKDKSDGPHMGSMSKQYLGFLVNTRVMKVFLPAEKVEALRDFLLHFLTSQDHSVKKLAKLLGKIVACIPSHGPYARICTRSGYIDLQRVVDTSGWDARVVISEATVRELQFFLKVLATKNGYPILHRLTDLRVDTILENPVSKHPILHQARGQYNAVVSSDASEFKVACKWLEGQIQEDFSFTLSKPEQLTSSGERELLAMLKAIRHFNEGLHITGVNFIWVTDSENLVAFINKGSPKPHIHEKITEIYALCYSMGCTIEPVHLLRTDERIVAVDELSKIRDTDNWSIDDNSFQILNKQFDLYSDIFADSLNKKLPVFISKYYEKGCYGVDAFACDWPGVAFCCPPTTLLARVAKRIRSSKCQGIIVFPDWPASDFYNAFFEANNVPKQPFQLVKEFHPYIFQNENAKNTPLFGHTAFKFYVLYFNTF